jgi:amino acid adenylation domain-containing protein
MPFSQSHDMNTCCPAGMGFETIHDLICKMANERPEAIFLISPEAGNVLTFRDLQQQSSVLASKFQQLGLTRGGKLAFLTDNGLFSAQLLLGAMYGGFVPVPLNVRAGLSQLTYTLNHCDANLVFVGHEYTSLIDEVVARVERAIQVIPADIHSISENCTEPFVPTLAIVPGPDDPALLMYTSGSTGQPKAAVHSHRTLLACARNVVSSHDLSAADRSLLVLPLYHINAQVVTLLPALLTGGSIVMPHRFHVSQFWGWLDEHRCTWSALVPTIIAQLLDWEDPSFDSHEAAFKRIRFLRTSSAPLSVSLHREFLDRFPLLLIQGMGSSEGGNVFSNPLPPGENKIGSVGLPTGFDIRVVNREGIEVPAGEPGEVLIRGAALAQGYYKEPEATAAVFDSEGWLHTGDLAFRDSDGYFFAVGRSKELIIKGGVNIAPRQIDEVLESHPAVLEAAVVGIPDHYVGEDLIAFAVLRAGMDVDEREMLAFCESRLGHFKTPTRIHFVTDLPKGPSGKVQRLRLIEKVGRPAMTGPVYGNDHFALGKLQGVTPTLEQAIAEIWTELLGQTQINSDSNFFSLGGHSLMAIQCLSRLREKLPVALSLSDFFKNDTVAQLAALVRQRLRAASCDGTQIPLDQPSASLEHAPLQQMPASAGSQPIPPRGGALPYPLSPAQQRIWFFKELAPTVPLYSESEAVRLLGDLKVDAMERALDKIVARHEILRTTIRIIEERPTAIVHDNWPLRLKRIDLSILASAQREAEVKRLLIEEPQRSYDLEAEPGIRMTLLRLDSREHVFILMMHHIICDRWSMGVFWREFAALYAAFSRGKPLALPPLPIHYGDYAVWQQHRAAELGFAEDLAYWEDNLRGSPALLELPADRTRPPVRSYRGARCRFKLKPVLAKTLRNCSRREKTSLFTFLTTALNVLLHRYTGSEDILLGIPIADRDREELRSVIGFLIDTHVLRTGLSADITFRELMARVQNGLLELYNHRHVPFDQVVSALRRESNLSYSPLFQVMVNWRDRDQQLSFIGLDGLVVESLLAENRTSKFDLTLVVTDIGEDGIQLEIEYNTDLFEDGSIVRMFGHYRTLLEAITQDPDQRIATIPLLTNAERRQLADWNNTEVEVPRDTCVQELFEAQVERAPHAVAVEFEGKRLTYAELNERANQIAHHLREIGVGPDDLVGVCMERSLEMVTALYGVLKAGGAYVPIDPEYPAERIAFMLEDSRAPVLLTQRLLAERLPRHDSKLICIDTDWDQIGTAKTTNPPPIVSADNLAYVIYTSGSTGRPKGAMNAHRGVTNRLLWMQRQYPLTEADTILQKTPSSFDVSVWEFFWPLLAGARLLVAKRGGHRDPAYLVDLIVKKQVTVVHFVPPMLRLFLEQPGAERCVSLRHVVCSGEVLPFDLQEKFFNLLPAQLHNLYGPTEAAVDVTHYTCQRNGGREIVPIGRPVANTLIYVLDQQLQPVPVGVSGELYIGGVQLGPGYYNRPELTKEKFLSNPFSTQPGRMYRTGDLARYLPDGNIEYLGRMDDQVKIRGFRVELGEIESVLDSHPEVRQNVVVAREDRAGDKRLVAYFVPTANQVPESEELRSLLKQRLPDYMVPTDYVALNELPILPNGKIDRKALPGPVRKGEDDGYIAPRDEFERYLCEAWATVLGLKTVGIRDNFFELGGHSLLAVQLWSRVQEILPGEQLPLSVLLEAPTVERFAVRLRNAKSDQHRFMVRVRPGSSARPPFFCVHGAGGNVLSMRPLAMALPADLPFYCFQDKGLDGSKPFESVEETARCYVDEIREIQPMGPYYLGGGCYGGVVAFEMARRLEELGERVAALILIDSYNPAYARFLSRRERLFRSVPFYTRRVAWHARRMFTQPPDEWLHYISGRRKALHKRMRGSAAAAASAEREAVEAAAGSPLGEILRRVIQANFVARSRFVPKPYGGSAFIFRASQRIVSPYKANHLGWEPVIRGGIECFEIEADHLSILEEPHVRLVAEKLDAKFRELAEGPRVKKQGYEEPDTIGVQAMIGR